MKSHLDTPSLCRCFHCLCTCLAIVSSSTNELAQPISCTTVQLWGLAPAGARSGILGSVRFTWSRGVWATCALWLACNRAPVVPLPIGSARLIPEAAWPGTEVVQTPEGIGVSRHGAAPLEFRFRIEGAQAEQRGA